MRVTFVYPSSPHRTGGVTVLYEFANGLARRGHEVQFAHGPLTEHRVDDVAEVPFRFDAGVQHRVVDDLSDPRLDRSDVVFVTDGPARLGRPCSFVQGHRMLPEEMEREGFLAPGPKVCVAGWLVEIGLGYGVDRRLLWHVPPGLDHEVFSAEVPQTGRTHDVAVLFHPHHNKGWDTALATLRLLEARRPGLRSMVFGMRRPDDELPSGSEFVLAPDHRQLAEHVYNAARVFLQSSRVEGFGYTPVEAMACGAALVTTDNGGSRDYADHGRTALVAPIEDPEALCVAVGRLLDDIELRTSLAEAGARRVRRFDWDASAALLERHLEAYVGGGAAVPQVELAHPTRSES
jgi:glycosyltransferase involved in cell wall biosynthesis